MFGFLKRKKKNKDEPSKKEAPSKKEGGETTPAQEKPKKKKWFSIKLLIIILVVLIAVGVSGFVVYKFWFSGSPEGDEPRVYQEQELVNVTLPEEMLRFSFDHFPVLYDAFVTFNSEMILLENEIKRIDEIAGLYPEQKKITEKQKKAWVKAKEALNKSFIKIEKPVKETYVLFRVNKEQGLIQINEKATELSDAAQSALTPAQEMTKILKKTDPVPDGLLKGTLYKLKKKFL